MTPVVVAVPGYRLATGDFANGWRHQGKKWGLRENARLRPDFAAPLWRGEPLAGKSLYVWSEQGLGDQVMFANMFPDLVAAGGRCTFEVHPRLERLFARSFPHAEVVGKRPRKASPRQGGAAKLGWIRGSSRTPHFFP